MPAILSYGASGVVSFAGMIIEAVPGTWSSPTSSMVASTASGGMVGGAKSMPAILGQIWENTELPSDVSYGEGTFTGPHVKNHPLMVAVLPTTNAAPVPYSMEYGAIGFATSKVTSAVVESYSFKGSLGSIVDFTASWKAMKVEANTRASFPTAPAFIPFSAIDITAYFATAAAGISFELTLTQNVAVQGGFGDILPKAVFPTGFSVTGKATVMITATPAFAVGAYGALVLTLDNSGDVGNLGASAQTYTLNRAKITKASTAVSVGGVMLQDIEFMTAISTATTAALILS